MMEARDEHASTTRSLYEMESHNFLLESELRGLKTEREIEAAQNIQHKIEILKVDTQKMILNAERMESTLNSCVR